MTAINALVAPSGRTGWLLADSAMTNDETKIFQLHSAKVTTFPHARAVAAASGKAPFTTVAPIGLARFATFDDVIAHGAEALRATWPATPEARVALVLMGWSDKHEAVRLYLAHSDRGFAPERFHEVTCPDIGLPPADYKRPDAYLLEIMQRQRRDCRERTSDNAADWPGVIGGVATLTTLDADGISQRIIHRWPEKIGEQILARN